LVEKPNVLFALVKDSLSIYSQFRVLIMIQSLTQRMK